MYYLIFQTLGFDQHGTETSKNLIHFYRFLFFPSIFENRLYFREYHENHKNSLKNKNMEIPYKKKKQSKKPYSAFHFKHMYDCKSSIALYINHILSSTIVRKIYSVIFKHVHTIRFLIFFSVLNIKLIIGKRHKHTHTKKMYSLHL